jgi:hypothetical protein
MKNAVRLRLGQRALIDKLQPTLRDGFLRSCQNIGNDVILKELVAALAQEDTELALNLLNIEPAAFRPYVSALENAWEAGGNLAANTMPRLVIKNA